MGDITFDATSPGDYNTVMTEDGGTQYCWDNACENENCDIPAVLINVGSGGLVGTQANELSGHYDLLCDVWQCGMSYDLSNINPFATLQSASLQVAFTTANYHDESWYLECWRYDWGAGYGASDFLTRTWLQSNVTTRRLTSIQANSMTTAQQLYTMTNDRLLSSIDSPSERNAMGQVLRVVFASSLQRTKEAVFGDPGYPDGDSQNFMVLHSGTSAFCPLHVTWAGMAMTLYPTFGMSSSYSSSDLSYETSLTLQSRMRMRPNIAQVFFGNVRVFDAQEPPEFSGVLPGEVQYTDRIDGSNSMTVVAPWEYRDGDTREDMVMEGYRLEYNGRWYIIQTYTRDKDTNTMTVDGVGREIELTNFLTNYSAAPLSMPSHTPTEIMDAVLGGEPECEWYNGDFSRLDDSGFPIGWVDSIGTWEANREGPTIDATGFTDGEAVLESWAINHVAGAEIKLKFDVYADMGYTQNIQAILSWQNSAGSETSQTVLTVPVSQGNWLSFEDTTWRPVLNERCVLKFRIQNNTSEFTVRFRAVRFVQNEDDTGWLYYGTMDTRLGDIAYNSPLIQKFGVWTLDTGNEELYSTTVDDTLGVIFTGQTITVHFQDSGVGALATVLVDGVTQATGIDISTGFDYVIDNLNPHRSHVCEVVVEAVKVIVSGFTQSTENRVAVTWNRLNDYDAIWELQRLVGGEFYFDTVAKIIYHDSTQGDNLTTNNMLWLREGPQGNLITFVPQTEVAVKNRVYYGGYGDGHFQIGVRLDSEDEDSEGNTSQERFGVQRFEHTNKDTRDYASAIADALSVVERDAFPKTSYTATVLTSELTYVYAGDTVMVWHSLLGDDPQELRILEVTRDTESAETTLVLGERGSVLDAAAQTEEIRRKVEQLLHPF